MHNVSNGAANAPRLMEAMMAISYNDMTEREAILRRALDLIAEGADPTLRPGHPAYMSKTAITATALRAIKECDALVEQVAS